MHLIHVFAVIWFIYWDCKAAYVSANFGVICLKKGWWSSFGHCLEASSRTCLWQRHQDCWQLREAHTLSTNAWLKKQSLIAKRQKWATMKMASIVWYIFWKGLRPGNMWHCSRARLCVTWSINAWDLLGWSMWGLVVCWAGYLGV